LGFSFGNFCFTQFWCLAAAGWQATSDSQEVIASMALQLLSLLLLGLMCGSELNVAAFAHPTISRQPLEARVLVRASFARLFGHVMPFWMAGSTLLNLLLWLPFEHLNNSAWRLAAIAGALQVFAVLFSLAGPVPIKQPDSQMDAAIASGRLARVGASMGSVALVENVWIGGGFRGSCRQHWRWLSCFTRNEASTPAERNSGGEARPDFVFRRLREIEASERA